MSRVKFQKGKQREFLELAISSLGVKCSGLAFLLGVCSRTVRDWKREKNNYVQHIIEDLFGITSTRRIRIEEERADIVVTGKNLIEFLEKMGIKKGNKVKNQVDIPEWIFERKEYQASCLRGLFDTDGCVYQHSYEVKGKPYRYVKMCFRNYSIPILESLKKILSNLGFNAKLDKRQKAVYLHSPREVRKYIAKIGTNNPRYKERYIEFFSKKIGRLRKGV